MDSMIITPNMGLVAWNNATDPYDSEELATNFAKLDEHDHTSGKGKQITTGALADASITADKLAPSTFTAIVPDGSITSAKLANNAVITPKILDGEVTTAKIASQAITTGLINDGDVTTIKIADANVTLAKLAANSVDATKIAGGAVDTTELANGGVTFAKLDPSIFAALSDAPPGDTTVGPSWTDIASITPVANATYLVLAHIAFTQISNEAKARIVVDGSPTWTIDSISNSGGSGDVTTTSFLRIETPNTTADIKLQAYHVSTSMNVLAHGNTRLQVVQIG